MSAPERRVPRGRPIVWTDDDLDAMSEVTPEDIAAAAEAWRRDASPRYRDLIDAEVIDDERTN